MSSSSGDAPSSDVTAFQREQRFFGAQPMHFLDVGSASALVTFIRVLLCVAP
jgi:hypothetical protein